ncbi:radical SAM protein [Candidatus Woesearchaeota archaeon]|nr:radical SAM protein [Candidatus Woesearchaeota archaeon]
MVKSNKFHSYNVGKLSKGCKLCVKGRKSVLFSTGICPRHCFYCPISEEKKDKDVIFINELKTDDFSKIIEEIKLCSSKGVGITGGDPLARLDRTCDFISRLKKEFGKKFHTHLYTSLILVNEKVLEKLYTAGLDEIRFHPDLENKQFWDRVKLFKKFKWDVGMEIPLIPGFEKITKELILHVKDYVDFINFNELEYSDNVCYEGRNLHVKDELSYAIKGSLELGLKLLDLCKQNKIRCHLCTAKLKDSVQLQNRMKLRLKNIKKWYDVDLDDGIFARGAIYIIKPEFNYKEKIKKISLKELEDLKNSLNFKTEIDEKKKRLLTSIKLVEKNVDLLKDKGLTPAIVQEYATSDQFELEIDFL